MERKIGEIFECNGEWYQCVKDSLNNCVNCCFYNGGHKECSDKMGECFKGHRSDNNGVYFKKLEKVGEPFSDEHFELIQKYELKLYGYSTKDKRVCFSDGYNVFIKTKQNQENMEDKKQTSLSSTKDIYEKFKGKTVQCLVNNEDGDLVNGYGIVCGYKDKYLIIGFTNGYEGCIKSFTDNVFLENRDFLSYRFWNISHVDDKPFIKPFNLEAAKAGKPVCTRDGRKARIICFDREFIYKGQNYCIVALINDSSYSESLYSYTEDGLFNPNKIHNYDLMMLPEKKEGWINICRNLNTNKTELDTKDIYNTKEEALQNLSSMTCVTTVKIEWEE